jgi:hypothetical protein
MRASTIFSGVALGSCAFAFPGPAEVTNVDTVVEPVTKTVCTTEGYAASTAAPTPVVEVTITYGAPEPTREVYQPPAQSPAQPTQGCEAPGSPQPSQLCALSPDNGYMGVVNDWRGKMDMPELEMNRFLQTSAEAVVKFSDGEMKHHLYNGTEGQVLAPGEAGRKGFEKVFVGGWLCEMPELKGLNSVCDEMSKGWAYQGQTSHAKILIDPRYKYIGCALNKGIWCCDVSAVNVDQEPEGGYEPF